MNELFESLSDRFGTGLLRVVECSRIDDTRCRKLVAMATDGGLKGLVEQKLL